MQLILYIHRKCNFFCASKYFSPSCSKLNTLKRNKNATLFQWKIHWALFKVLDRDNEPSNFQEMFMNAKKTLFKIITN